MARRARTALRDERPGRLSGVATLGLFVLSVSAWLGGCGTCDTSGKEPVLFTEGLTNDSGTVYQTTGVDAPYLHFPSGRTFDLTHGLVATPYLVQTYTSFEDEPLERSTDDETNNLAEASGNLAVIEAWNDELIRVRNDTCAEMYLRVVAVAEQP